MISAKSAKMLGHSLDAVCSSIPKHIPCDWAFQFSNVNNLGNQIANIISFMLHVAIYNKQAVWVGLHKQLNLRNHNIIKPIINFKNQEKTQRWAVSFSLS